MWRRRLRQALAAMLLTALGACAAYVPPPPEPYTGPFASLDETYWRSIDTDGAPPGVEIRFKWNSLYINPLCVFSDLSLSGTPDRVQLSGKFQSGGKSCGGGPELDAFLDRLRWTSSFAPDDNTLAFRDASGRAIATFARIADTGFEYRDLQLVSFRHLFFQVSAKLLHQGADIRFFKGRVEGRPGCGNIFGTYDKTAPDTIHVSTTWIIMGSMCESDYLSFDHLFHDVYDDLNGDRRVEVAADGRVTLRDLDGNVRAILAPVK